MLIMVCLRTITMPPLTLVLGVGLLCKYKIVSLTAETIPGALNVIKEDFFKDETVSIATEVNINSIASEELLELCADAALDGISVAAVEISSGKVVATCFNKLQVSTSDPAEKPFFDVFAEERCTQASSKALMQFMSEVDGQCNFFEKYGVDCSLELMFLGTLREHRRQKLALLLCKATLDIGRKLKDGPVSHITLEDLGPKYSHMQPRSVTTKVPLICQVIGTSIATQKIGKALEFTVHLRVSFTEFVYNGKNYVERVGSDPYCEAIARHLD